MIIAHQCLKAEEGRRVYNSVGKLKKPCICSCFDVLLQWNSRCCQLSSLWWLFSVVTFFNYSQLANLILLPRLLLELSYFIIYNYFGIVNENNPTADSVIYNLSNCRFSLISYYLPNLCCAKDCYYCHLFKK